MRILKPRSLPPPRRHRTRRHPRVCSGSLFRLRPWLEAMEDRTLLSTLLVTNTADSGAGSLRQAILDSNAATAGASVIDFAIPGQGVQTIAPLSALPPITHAVLIDGFSQSGLHRHSAHRAQRQPGRRGRRADDQRIECHGSRPGHRRIRQRRRRLDFGAGRELTTGSTRTRSAPTLPVRPPIRTRLA